MSWNYRVIQKSTGGFISFGIHEVYYRPDGSIESWSENPVIAYGETPEELNLDFSKQLLAFERPVLDYDQLLKDHGEI